MIADVSYGNRLSFYWPSIWLLCPLSTKAVQGRCSKRISPQLSLGSLPRISHWIWLLGSLTIYLFLFREVDLATVWKQIFPKDRLNVVNGLLFIKSCGHAKLVSLCVCINCLVIFYRIEGHGVECFLGHKHVCLFEFKQGSTSFFWWK